MMNEPELSRRVLRLTFANWLAHDQDPDPRHRSPSVLASFKLMSWNTAIPFFATGHDAPEHTRRMALTSCALARDRSRRSVGPVQWPWWSIRLSEKRRGTRGWSCCWPRSCIAASTELRLGTTRPWSVLISVTCRMMALLTSLMDRPSGCSKRPAWSPRQSEIWGTLV